jgi:hypothetical protein
MHRQAAPGLRLASMIAMLAVLALLISRAADPNTWTWLTGESPKAANGNDVQLPTTPTPALSQGERGPVGPTDLDAEEREGAEEQFLALTDGTTELSREEMPAYWRLFRWVEHQSLVDMQRRAKVDAVLNDFMQRPGEQRGKLFRLDLNVRRVLSYDAPANSAGIEKVYEIWGWTTESKAWLYCVLTAHLPTGMPQGPDIHERATFAGYFLKVQGYQAAGAAPGDKPLAAPLLIGRVAWQPAAVATNSGESGTWLWWFAAIACAYGMVRIGIWLWGRTRSPQPEVLLAARSARRSKRANLRGWLAETKRNSDEGEGYTSSGKW